VTAEGHPLLVVDDLRTGFHTARGVVWAVDGVSLEIRRGTSVGIVGESGSGKTALSRSIMGLLPGRNIRREGSVVLGGHQMVGATPAVLRRVWGQEVAMVFQDPMTSLNPVVKVGRQITESLRFHGRPGRAEERAIAVEMLRSVRIPEPERRLDEYPHQLSGGMRQRVSIAAALVCGPQLLIADEPTTALDVTVQAEILQLLDRQRRERFMAMVLITHDLGVVAGRTDSIAVMYAGQIVEQAPTRALFAAPLMPYTNALLRSTPRLGDPSHTRLVAIPGRPPDLAAPPPGCRFAPRCAHVQDRCTREAPPLVPSGAPDHLVRCWYPGVA
jgi:oligopeptide/dipeptide ABC transporter ATP-binding protein